jgi:ATP-dependent DNA helicase RecG
MGTFITRFAKPIPPPERPPKLSRQERYSRTLAYVREHGSITRAEYLDQFRLSGAQVSRDLAELVERGLLLQVGLGRTTRYVLPDEG